jgi:hypothetical protein
MSHPYYHAKSSAKKFGGAASDYQHIHDWFDQTKSHVADVRHRALLHSSFGIFLCEQVFGTVLTRKSDGRTVPVRTIGEQHVLEDMGRIPTPQDWLKNMPLEAWMARGAKKLSEELPDDPAAPISEAIPCEACVVPAGAMKS